MTYDRSYKIKYLNRFYSLAKFFPDWDGRGNVRCPFHADSSPSARLFVKENGHADENLLQCFKCGRFFYTASFIYKNRLNYEKMFEEVYKIYGHQDIEFKKEVEKVEVKREGKSFIEFTKEYFKIEK